MQLQLQKLKSPRLARPSIGDEIQQIPQKKATLKGKYIVKDEDGIQRSISQRTLPMKVKKQKPSLKKAEDAKKPDKNQIQVTDEDIDISVTNLPESSPKDMNQMRIEVLSHILGNKNQQNPRLLSYGDLPKLKKPKHKDAFRQTV